MTIKLLRTGFDAMDVAFKGTLPRDTLEKLEEAREEAQKNQRPVLLHIGPAKIPVHVHEHGKKGGYRYRLDTGPEGEIWFIKNIDDAEQWNIFVSPRAFQLALRGLEGTIGNLFAQLDAMGATVVSESINRVDFAVDVLAPDFELDPALFVAHPHCVTKERFGRQVVFYD